MAMNKEDLVRLMDAYMGCEGYYMKPKTDKNGEMSFFIAQGDASSTDMNAGFETVKDAIGTKEERPPQVFAGEPRVECAVCADIPNLSDIDSDN